MSSVELSAEEITRKAKSNLAFAFAGMPKARKRLLNVFYAFCRVIDDIADSTELSSEEKYRQLDHWSDFIRSCPDQPASSLLEKEVEELLILPQVDRNAMLGIIEGCRSDVEPAPFETFNDLMWYTYRVASCVGIVSATLFGAGPEARDYAIALGHALQITNIIRDVGEDWRTDNRIYLPLRDLEEHSYTQEDLKSGIYNDAFLRLMHSEADKAQSFYDQAFALYKTLPAQDRKALAPAVAMGMIYHHILRNMQKEGFRVFSKKYSLSKWSKARHLISAKLLSLRDFPSL